MECVVLHPILKPEHFANMINNYCDEIEAIIGPVTTVEPYAALSADGLTVTFYYDDQKMARGGMDINTQSWDIENGAVPPYGGITKVSFSMHRLPITNLPVLHIGSKAVST